MNQRLEAQLTISLALRQPHEIAQPFASNAYLHFLSRCPLRSALVRSIPLNISIRRCRLVFRRLDPEQSNSFDRLVGRSYVSGTFAETERYAAVPLLIFHPARNPTPDPTISVRRPNEVMARVE